MAMKNPYGLKDGQVVTVDSVERGLACGCTCPKCSGRLEARQGDEREHYFAHDDGLDCGVGYQTALQMFAKEVLDEEKRLHLPPIAIYPSENHPLRSRVYREVVREDFLVVADEVSLECKIGRLIPDVVFRVKERLLLIEIWVTHRINAEDLAKIRSLGVGAIQFNFSKTDHVVTKEELRQVLMLGRSSGLGRAEWLHNPQQQGAQEKLDREFAADPRALVEETKRWNRLKRTRQAPRQTDGKTREDACAACG